MRKFEMEEVRKDKALQKSLKKGLSDYKSGKGLIVPPIKSSTRKILEKNSRKRPATTAGDVFNKKKVIE